MRRQLLAIGCLLSGAFGVIAFGTGVSCSVPEEATFGNPNTLSRSNLPGEGGVEELVCTGGEAGTTTFDGGCPSFDADIYPYFAPTGPWHCGDKACHGGTSDPPIDTSAPDKCLAALQKATVTGLPYVVSDGGKDPNASSILCNLQGSCGSKMPQPPGKDPTDAELCVIQAWLKCGAPK